MGTLGSLGGMGSFGGRGHGSSSNHDDHSDHDDHQGNNYSEDEYEEYEEERGRFGGGQSSLPMGLSLDSIINLVNAGASLLGNLPDIKGMIPMMMDQGYSYVTRFMNSLPGMMRRIRPEAKQILKDAKEPLQKLAATAMKMKQRLMGRKSWRNMAVDLDLLERALSFCPGVNMTALDKSGIPWDSFEFQLLDKCVEAGCDGKYDLCCPFVRPNTYGLLEAKCIYSTKKHFGECPKGYTEAFIDQSDIMTIMARVESFPECRMDTDCKINERCCMHEDRSKDTATPLTSCQLAERIQS